ncbi:carotenoid oxygenase [Ectocarpus siliculosus]|uniref:Carotenoid oxygenase n=1 Tax=Ectocarpus siliculosus TaxID=2880 RepID=D8LJ08_ECTSI|nr:carotenoid oxygenase [Ectocarpus siliculosus]|eukprot:CBN76892.1 carotenoid oxygenase [Ectocarpus siliculosus]
MNGFVSESTTAAVVLLILFHLRFTSAFAGGKLPISNGAPKLRAGQAMRDMCAAVSMPSFEAQGVPEVFLQSIREEPWRGTLQPCIDHPLTEIEVTGKVPKTLEGTLFRNGPARNWEGERMYGHWFDGDGMISKVVFKDGRVYAQNRFVSTDSWDPNAPEGKRAAGTRRPWTPRPGGWRKNVLKQTGNLANTSVMVKGGKLYALYEGGKPTEIDPVTLETLGERDLGGIQAFYSAHPTTDRDTGETFNIGIGGAKGALEITKLSPDGVLQKSTTYTPPASLFWHDNTITDEFVVAVSSPFAASLKSIFASMLGFGQLGDAFRWNDNMKSEAFFFSRETLELVKRVELPGAPSSYHIVNGFQEEGKGSNVSVIIAKHRDGGGREKIETVFRNLMTTRFSEDVLCDAYKYEIDMEAGEVVSHGPAASMQGALAMELPTMDFRYVGKPSRIVFTNALLGDPGFLNSVQRVDLRGKSGEAWTTHDFGESRYAGEPVFVPSSKDAQEGEGYLIVLVYNTKTHTTDVEVLDAQKVESPPLCTARIPWHMGASFHGVFTPTAHL